MIPEVERVKQMTVTMSNVFLLIVFAANLRTLDAASSPALIWSSSRPMSDLPAGIAGNTVSVDNFHDTYLKPLASSPEHSLVVFVQNKLSVEDFTKHADVYNPSSDGGAFKNVKTAMDESYSIQLPTVSSPTSAIETLLTSFTGEVIKVDNPDEVQTLNLDPSKSYMIVVNLPPVTKHDEYGSFQASDAAIGHCMRHMQKRGLKFSAVYTAEDSQISASDVHSGRRLLANEGATNDNYTGSFWSSENALIFMKSVNLTITRAVQENKQPKENYQWTFDQANVSSSLVNESIEIEMKFDNPNGTATISFALIKTDNMGTQWKSMRGSLSVVSKDGPKHANLSNLSMDYDIESLKGYCYHCGKLVPKPSIRNYTDNNTIPAGDVDAVELILYRFQLDISFNATLRNMSNENTTFSADVWECVEFFTIPIWMGLLSSLILMMVLFYGITMISNITTMDRFDDPKGKTITVTVNE